jgi:hypothetical protein
MRTIIKTVIILLLLSTILSTPRVEASPLYAAIIYKDGDTYYAESRQGTITTDPDAYKLVQDLLPSCTGTIYFCSGTYVFSQGLFINSNISLSGESENSVTLHFLSGGLVFNYTGMTTIRDLLLEGTSTDDGCGLTLDWTWRTNIYNVEITNFKVGFNGTSGLFSNIYDLNVHDNYIGVWLGLKYGNYHFYGGSIQYNEVGLELFSDVIIDGVVQSTNMNQFYGTEIELNSVTDVYFNAGVGIIAGNIFEGCYFERSLSTTENFFTYNNGANVRANSFISCKFASQINSQLELQGVGHVFVGNWFDGPSLFTVLGSNHTITDNKAISDPNQVVFVDNSTASTIKNNSFFEGTHNMTSTETATASPTPQTVLFRGNFSSSLFPAWTAIGGIGVLMFLCACSFYMLRGKARVEMLKKNKINEQETNK